MFDVLDVSEVFLQLPVNEQPQPPPEKLIELTESSQAENDCGVTGTR